MLSGCPQTLRFDAGTENTIIKHLQTFLHQNNPSEKPCVLIGKSTANQRIEAWWGILRKHQSQFWINLFQKLKEDGHFTGSWLDKNLIRFVFLDIIKTELEEIKTEWNSHKIRKTKNAIAPSGRPITMFHVPETYKTHSYLHAVNREDLDILKEECTFPTFPCDSSLFEYCNIVMVEKQLQKATEAYKAIDLYITLRTELLNSLPD